GPAPAFELRRDRAIEMEDPDDQGDEAHAEHEREPGPNLSSILLQLLRDSHSCQRLSRALTSANIAGDEPHSKGALFSPERARNEHEQREHLQAPEQHGENADPLTRIRQ